MTRPASGLSFRPNPDEELASGSAIVPTPADLDSEFGSWCAFDAAGDKIADVVVQHVADENGVIDHTDVLNIDGTPFVTPYDSLGACRRPSSGVVTFHELCDDINGDSSVIVPYVEVIVTDIDALGAVTRRIDSTWVDEDMLVGYTPANPVHCNDLGAEVNGLSQHRQVINGPAIWERPPLTTSVTVSVIAIGDATNPPTVTDANNAVTDLLLGSETWTNPSWELGAGVLVAEFAIRTHHPADVVIISTTQLHTA